MAGQPPTEIDALTAPPDDGGTLIWPRHPSLAAIVDANRRLRQSCALQLLGESYPELLHDELSGPPIIISGHQPMFIHAGVWAKNVVTSSLAARVGGQARFLIVDSDVAPKLALAWPETADRYHRAAFAALPSWFFGCSYEQLPAVPGGMWRAFFEHLPERWRSDATSAMPTFMQAFLHGPPAPDYVTRWINGVSAVEHSFDVVSPVFTRDSGLWSERQDNTATAAWCFTAYVLLHADEFLAAYNTALAGYRERRGIRGRQHPIPDLVHDGDRLELPFWVLHSAPPRRRLFVAGIRTGAIQLWAAADPIGTLSRAELASSPIDTLSHGLGQYRIRPRALTLTMFARLFACDLFIHGIGGAKYDQITDEIIRLFFHTQPPAYACVSATCRLPLRTHAVTLADRAACAHRLRDLNYNPQRYLVDADAKAAVAGLLTERNNAIAESERLRRLEPRHHAARRNAFTRIRHGNAALLELIPEATGQTQQRLAEIEAQLKNNEVAGSREWFFAFLPVDILLRLRDALTALV